MKHLNNGGGRPICNKFAKGELVSWEEVPTCPSCVKIREKVLARVKPDPDMDTVLFNKDTKRTICGVKKKGDKPIFVNVEASLVSEGLGC